MKKMSEKDKAELVKIIISNFDFKMVYKVMSFLDWKWMGERPTILQIKLTAERLLYTVLNNENTVSSGTGGLEAYKNDCEIGLRFNLEHFEYEFEDVIRRVRHES